VRWKVFCWFTVPRETVAVSVTPASGSGMAGRVTTPAFVMFARRSDDQVMAVP